MSLRGLVLAGLSALGAIGFTGSFPASAAYASTGLHAPVEGAWFAPTLRWEGGSLEVTFGMDEAAQVSLVAYDAQGRSLATLFDGRQASGFHRLSVFSNRLQCRDGRVRFQLRAGGEVLADLRPQELLSAAH